MSLDRNAIIEVTAENTNSAILQKLDRLELNTLSHQTRSFLVDLRADVEAPHAVSRDRIFSLLQKHALSEMISDIELIYKAIDSDIETFSQEDFDRLALSRSSALLLFAIKKMKKVGGLYLQPERLRILLSQLGSLPDRGRSYLELAQNGILPILGSSILGNTGNALLASFNERAPLLQGAHIISQISLTQGSEFIQKIAPRDQREFLSFLESKGLKDKTISISENDQRRVLQLIQGALGFLGGEKRLPFEIREQIYLILKRSQESRKVTISGQEVLLHPQQRVSLRRTPDHTYLVLQRGFGGTEEIVLDERYTIESHNSEARIKLSSGLSILLTHDIECSLPPNERFSRDFPYIQLLINHWLIKAHYLLDNPGWFDQARPTHIRETITQLEQFVALHGTQTDPMNPEQSMGMLGELLKIMCRSFRGDSAYSSRFLGGVYNRYNTIVQTNGNYNDDANFSRMELFSKLLNRNGLSHEQAEAEVYRIIKGMWSDGTSTTPLVQDELADKVITTSLPYVQRLFSSPEFEQIITNNPSEDEIAVFLTQFLSDAPLSRDEVGKLAKLLKEKINEFNQKMNTQRYAEQIQNTSQRIIAAINAQKSIDGQSQLTPAEELVIKAKLFHFQKSIAIMNVFKHGLLKSIIKNLPTRQERNSYVGIYANTIGLSLGEASTGRDIRDFFTLSDENFGTALNFAGNMILCTLLGYGAGVMILRAGTSISMSLLSRAGIIAGENGAWTMNGVQVSLAAQRSIAISGHTGSLSARTGGQIVGGSVYTQSFSTFFSRRLTNPGEFGRLLSLNAAIGVITTVLTRGTLRLAPSTNQVLSDPRIVGILYGMGGNTGLYAYGWANDVEFIRGDRPETAEEWFDALIAIGRMRQANSTKKLAVSRTASGSWVVTTI